MSYGHGSAGSRVISFHTSASEDFLYEESQRDVLRWTDFYGLEPRYIVGRKFRCREFHSRSP
jgi:hypothetical protein